VANRVNWNEKIIDEFRSNGGRVGGNFEGAPLLLLHSTGAKSGEERINPMMYQRVGDAYAVFASKGGAPSNPDTTTSSRIPRRPSRSATTPRRSPPAWRDPPSGSRSGSARRSAIPGSRSTSSEPSGRFPW
jgi:hypothetical protein